MGNRPTSDSATVASEIVARKNELLRKQAELSAQRADITSQMRQIDRDLADCRATARFFNLQIEFPDDEEDRLMAARREHEMRMARTVAAHGTRVARAFADTSIQRALIETVPASASSAVTAEDGAPPLREFLLTQLKQIGSAGAKATGLRALYEQSHNKKIHGKTVGMTLYRLSASNEVHRKGHVWYYGPAAGQSSHGEIAA